MNKDLNILGNLIKYLQQFPPDTKVFAIADCSSPFSFESNYKQVELEEDYIDYNFINKTLVIGN